MIFVLLFTCALIAVVLGGIGTFLYDTGWRPNWRTVRRIAAGVLLALVIARGVYAAEVRPLTCDAVEKYSLLWYAQWCFLWESSS